MGQVIDSRGAGPARSAQHTRKLACFAHRQARLVVRIHDGMQHRRDGHAQPVAVEVRPRDLQRLLSAWLTVQALQALPLGLHLKQLVGLS